MRMALSNVYMNTCVHVYTCLGLFISPCAYAFLACKSLGMCTGVCACVYICHFVGY